MRSLALAIVLAAPHAGVVVPGKTFAGLWLGATPAQVGAAWGARHGTCRKCERTTWYFNEKPFEPQGAAVEFERGRAVAYFTVWQPQGWTTSSGVRLGQPEEWVTRFYGQLQRVTCGAYDALRLRSGRVDTYIYVRAGQVYGFGLSRAAVPACR